MMKILIPLILLIIGLGSGVGAALFLAPPASVEVAEIGPCGDTSPEETAHEDDSHSSSSDRDYAKLNNQFIVPIVEDGKVASLIVMALSVEVSEGGKEAIYLSEPKLRDSFLQAMFDHANIGGFSGNFTSAQKMRPLRQELVLRAKRLHPGIVSDVLVIDITRQDA